MSSKHIVSKKRVNSLQLTATALSSAMLLASAGAAVAADVKDAKKLDKVKVEADAVESFKAEKVSSPKFTQPLVDTPQTIVVVKKELFQQQAATTLSEALRNTPGITMLMGENGNTSTGDSIFMRGFDTQGSIFVDGIRDLGSISRDTFNTEQIEIAKGPAGVDNGRGAASGYVNLSSKLANQENALSGNVSGGSGDYKRATLDVNRTLGDSSAVRINLLKQDAGVAGRDEVENNFEGFAASLAFGLGSETRTYFNYLSMKQAGVPDGGVSSIGVDGYYNAIFDSRPSTTYPAGGPLANQKPQAVDRSNFYGSTSDHNDVNANMATVRIEHDIADGVVLRNTSRYGRTNQEQVLTGINGVTFVNQANPDTWTIARSRQGRDQTNQVLTNQTNLSASFETGGIKHDLSSGVEFLYESQLSYTMGIPFLSPTSATTTPQAPANLYSPQTSDVFQPLVRTGAKTDGETTTYALYAHDTVTFSDQWELSAGIRAERFHTKTDTLTRQGTANPQTIPVGTLLGGSVKLDDELFSWKLGALYKPAENGSIYISYATSQLPPGSSNFSLSTAANNANNPNVDPQKGINYEIGTKWNVLDNKLALTAAVFRSTNENEFASNTDGTTTAVGKRQVEGVELGAVGSITEKWQISAGLAFMDPEITRGNRATAAASTDGGTIQWSPKTTFTLWNSYVFDNGLAIGGGARYMDSVVSTSLTDADALSRRSVAEIQDYWVVDAMASYAFTKNITVQLNLMNIADEEYVATLNNAGARYIPGVERSARLGVNFAF